MQATDDGIGAFAWQMLQLVKIQAQPQLIYTSSKADADFLDKLREPYSALDEEGGSHQIVPQVRIEKATIFLIEQVHL